jgi:hypothetical protein
LVVPTPADADGGYHIDVSRRLDALDAGTLNPFGNRASVYVPPDPSTFVDHPIVTSDELTLYLATSTPNDPVLHIETATRATVDEPFGALTPVHELDSTEGESPTWISPDRCRLYITRKVGGQWDLYVASRSP